jgi:hypothetical protein
MGLRLVELALFLLPFVLYVLWRRLFAGPGPSAGMLALTLVGLAAFGVALAWFGIGRSLGPTGRYIPAQLVNGQIVEGHTSGLKN